MSIIAMANKMWKKASQQNDLLFEHCTSGQKASIKGIGTAHSVSIGTDGVPFNAPNVHVSFHESLLRDANPDYKIRVGEDVNLDGHLVSFNDSNGTLQTYSVKETFPDNTVGMIVCMCSLYERVAFEKVQNDI